MIYLDVIKEALEYYKNCYEVIAYTLMTNHVHLQIKTMLEILTINITMLVMCSRQDIMEYLLQMMNIDLINPV